MEDAVEWLPKGKSRQKQPHLILVDFNTTGEIYCKQKDAVLKPEGLKESLLCQDCETRIVQSEKYARECLYGSEPIKKHTRPFKSVRRFRERRGLVIREGADIRWVDYDRFKLFQTSIIWRACVAKGNAFKHVRAPADSVERMRCALLGGKIDEHLVPCAMELLEATNGSNLGMFSFPVAEDNIVCFVMGGYSWYFYVGGNAPTEIILRKSGYLFIKVSDIDRFYTPDSMLQKH